MTIINSTFDNTHCPGVGSAIVITDVSANITNSVFYNNTGGKGTVTIKSNKPAIANGNWWGSNDVEPIENVTISDWLILTCDDEGDRFILKFKKTDGTDVEDFEDILPNVKYEFTTDMGYFENPEGVINNTATVYLYADRGGEYHILGKVNNQSFAYVVEAPYVELDVTSPVKLGEDVVFTTKTHYNSIPVEGKIAFYDNEDNLLGEADTDGNGVASFTLSNCPVGDYSHYYAKFEGNDDYIPAYSNKINFAVEKADSNVEISLEDVVYSMNIKGNVTLTGNGNPISGTVNVTINSKTYVIDVVDGKGSVDIANELPVGQYDVSASFDGDEMYNPSKVNKTFDVMKADSAVSVSCDNITYGENLNIEVLATGEGKGLNGTATVTIGGEDYDV
ncbi:MAG: Ig-like domain-containing protein, partial [Methanobrevibacter sp.]|uniref:Ig-like domain-containing protein n=1 Tax=Methanobrevibacter sp. TaxID=66852 RepID=UPI0026DF3CBD